MSGSKSKKAVSAAKNFREGHARVAYRPRGTITAGLNSGQRGNVCDCGESLLDRLSKYKTAERVTVENGIQ